MSDTDEISEIAAWLRAAINARMDKVKAALTDSSLEDDPMEWWRIHKGAEPAEVIERCQDELNFLEHNAELHQLADPAAHPDQAVVLAADKSEQLLRTLAYSYRDLWPGYREEWGR